MTAHEAGLWRLLELLTNAINFVLQKLIAFHPPRATLVPSFGPARNKTRRTQMSQQIFNTQEIDVTLTPDYPLDGAITWEVLDGNSTFTNVSADGTTATLRSEDGIGTTNFKATGDADLSGNVVPISVVIELIVIGPQAQTLGVAFGEPRLKT